jgi:hypothetical protein
MKEEFNTHDDSTELFVIGMEISASNFVSINGKQNSIFSAFQRQKETQQHQKGKVCVTIHSPLQEKNNSKSQRNVCRSGIESSLTQSQNNEAIESSSNHLIQSGKLQNMEGNDVKKAAADANSTEHLDYMMKSSNDDKRDERIHIKSGSGGEDTIMIDADLEYAKHLQASFDREQQTFQSIERRWSSSGCSSPKTKPSAVTTTGKRKAKDSLQCDGQKSIMAFFSKNPR